MKEYYKILLIYFIVIALLIFLGSCNSQKTATKKYYKAKSLSEITVARLTRIDYPCITKSADTVILSDTLIQIDSVPYQVLVPFTLKGVDGYDSVITMPVLIQGKTRIITNTKVITNQIEDSAKIKEKELIIDSLNKQITKLESTVIKKSKSVSGWRSLGLFSAGAILIFLIITAIRKFK